MKYRILIQWSDEDNCYVVILPDWEDVVLQPVTDGATYEEAARKGEDMLAFLIQTIQQEGTPLPEPKVFLA
jgi:predicted RNase H-like HicB family nuclease